MIFFKKSISNTIAIKVKLQGKKKERKENSRPEQQRELSGKALESLRSKPSQTPRTEVGTKNEAGAQEDELRVRIHNNESSYPSLLFW